MKPVRFHRAARRELDEAMAFYEGQAAGLGLDLQSAVETATLKIASTPQSWPPHGSRGYRKFFVQRFPYTIFYLDLDKCIWIAAVAHGRRAQDYWRERRSER